MPIRSVKPTSPARRYMTFVVNDDITKSTPEKSLLSPKRRSNGRNVSGPPPRPLDQYTVNVANGEVVVSKVRELGVGNGYNAATDTYGDLVAQGVLDPVKVTRSALVNATSIAGMLLTTETLVVEKPEEEKAPAANGHGHSHPH